MSPAGLNFSPRALLACGALVLSATAWSQAVPAAQAEALDADEPPMMPMPPAAPPAGVRKLSDAGLSCEQIHAEATSLEKSIVQHRAASDAAQREANEAQQAMMSSASSGMGTSMATGLLGMLPGGGMVSGMAAQAAAQAQMSAMREGQGRMMSAYQRMAQAQEALAYAQARNDHLVGMFLQKGCKLPQAGK
jgi:hypothetical protein